MDKVYLLSQVHWHLQGCPLQIVSCPNCLLMGTVSNLVHHMILCPDNVECHKCHAMLLVSDDYGKPESQCPHKDLGCTFLGSASDVHAHL